MISQWRYGVSGHRCCTTSFNKACIQVHATKPPFRFWAGSNSAREILKIRDGEDL